MFCEDVLFFVVNSSNSLWR